VSAIDVACDRFSIEVWTGSENFSLTTTMRHVFHSFPANMLLYLLELIPFV
jgi:hypothetical protein